MPSLLRKMSQPAPEGTGLCCVVLCPECLLSPALGDLYLFHALQDEVGGRNTCCCAGGVISNEQ